MSKRKSLAFYTIWRWIPSERSFSIEPVYIGWLTLDSEYEAFKKLSRRKIAALDKIVRCFERKRLELYNSGSVMNKIRAKRISITEVVRNFLFQKYSLKILDDENSRILARSINLSEVNRNRAKKPDSDKTNRNPHTMRYGDRCRYCHQGDYSHRQRGDPCLCVTCMRAWAFDDIKYRGPFIGKDRQLVTERGKPWVERPTNKR